MKPLSVVLRVRNEEDYIGSAIQSCLDHLPKGSEIIVVDNESSDNSLQVARLFKHDTSLPPHSSYIDMHVYTISDYSPGRAINLGVRNASHEYILLLSSHCVLTRFPDNLYDHLDDKTIALFGNQTPIYMGKRLKKSYLWSHFKEGHIVQDMYSELEQRYFFHNALALFRRESLLQYPFDEDLVGKEDRYWARAIRDIGLHYLYVPDFTCYHHYTSNGNTWKGIG